MNDVSELFWNASVEELKQGFIWDSARGEYVCLVCGSGFVKGVIYREADAFYEAEKYIQLHIQHEHTSMFDYLVGLDKRLTGLTDHQKQLFRYFHDGISDTEIAKELGGSASTVRNHRFAMREREKQARLYLAMMGLIADKTPKKQRLINVHRTAPMVDERFAITEQEQVEILSSYFPQGANGPLASFPKKEKRKVAILMHLIKRFEIGRTYTEPEVNEILRAAFHDHVTLRRYLIEYGFMDRNRDCSAYWVKV